MARVAVLLISVLVALAASECGLRAFMPRAFWNPPSPGAWGWLEEDPVRSWRNRPRFEHRAFRIDAYGYRGPERAPERPPGVRRIVCLGDSGTFGLWRVGPQRLAFDNYPEMLQSLLDASGVPWEVWNGGVLGYSSSTALRFFQTGVIELEPDVVSLRVGFNDHSLTDRPERRIREPDPAWLRGLFYATHHLRLVQLGLAADRRWTARRAGSPSLSAWVPPGRFRRDLERFIEVARQRGIRLLLLDYPLRALERGESPGSPLGASRTLGASTLEELHALHDRYQAIQREVAHAESVELVVTARRFAAAAEEPFSDHDLVHPNAVGARLIAESLFERLVPSRAHSLPGRDAGSLRAQGSR